MEDTAAEEEEVDAEAQEVSREMTEEAQTPQEMQMPQEV
jgi:hypothetical protein